MQAMNASVRNAVFFPAFFLTPVILLIAASMAIASGRRTSALGFTAAALVYLVGAFVATLLVNVPMNEALAVEEELEEHQPSADLLDLEGMDNETAYALAAHGVQTVEALGEFAADEVAEFGIEGLDEARAAALILAARAEEIARLERES